VHNNQRDGYHRQAIARGRVAYEPNSLGGGCPFQAGAAGFTSFPKAIESENTPVDKVRGRPERFAEHYAQAKLFFESQTEVEKAHIRAAFRFELSKVTVPAIRARMVSSLLNVSKELAGVLANDLGIELPEPMPRAAKSARKPEISISPALSLKALPGDGGIATRKIAFLLADGIEAEPIKGLIEELNGAGAVTRLLASRLGTVRCAGGELLEIDATLENSPAVLFDALVLPGGGEAVDTLCLDGHTLEFIKDQYRHCKTILALGDSSKVLTKAGIPLALPSGDADPGLLVEGQEGSAANAQSFILAIGLHRHVERDRDPPLV
jgi:catalase